MELIPLITLKKRTILDTDQKTTDTKEIKQLKEDEKIYVLDQDGIEKDKPNLCLFQNISSKYGLWIDSRPIDLGDVVDSFMAGAASITIRKNLWDKLDIKEIREITENNVFFEIDIKDADQMHEKDYILDQADGFVIFNDKDFIDSDNKYSVFLKSICGKNKTYAYESKPENINYWKNKGAHGLLIDIEKIEGFKKRWQMMQKSQ